MSAIVERATLLAIPFLFSIEGWPIAFNIEDNSTCALRMEQVAARVEFIQLLSKATSKGRGVSCSVFR